MTAQLYTERIAQRAAERWLLLTHGIYGAGSNWRAIARKLTDRRPEWGVLLVDLRQHGRSPPGEPPHTLAAAADDVRAVAHAHAVTAIAGHSFGGKVVLAARPLARAQQTWVFDASPSARPGAMSDRDNTVLRVLELLERLPARWPRREDFVAAVTAEGHGTTLAQWLAMNLVPASEVARRVSEEEQPARARSRGDHDLAMRLDTAALRALLTDYYAVDLWSSLADPAPGDIHLVIATRSRALDDDDRARLQTTPPHVHVHEIDADHWLHVEAPEAVVSLLASQLR